MELYLRGATLTVGEKKIITRLSFTVEKTIVGKVANKCKVAAYNLSANTKAYIEKYSGLMRLEAGYQDKLSILFLGDIKKVEHKRESADILTTIESGDGEKKITSAHVELSLAPGASVSQVVNAAVKAMGLAAGVIKGVPNTKYSNGFAYSGNVRDLLNLMAAKSDLDWSVQNNTLQIFPKDQDTGETAVLLNERTGLIGVPNKTEEGFKAKSLLNPEIMPGRMVKIEAKSLTGQSQFKVDTVKHTGDTQEGEWYTELEGGGKGKKKKK